MTVESQTTSSSSDSRTEWWLFRGTNKPSTEDIEWPPAPPWRRFADPKRDQPPPFIAETTEINAVNAALYLRRPLLVTGKPGTGKSTLAYAVAHELRLGEVLYWPINSRSTIDEALYSYDAIGRLHTANIEGAVPNIGEYIQLGPLGTALLPSPHPRVLLIDEIDKSDIDLPNDLLTIFEEGRYEIRELRRSAHHLSNTPDSDQKNQGYVGQTEIVLTGDKEPKRASITDGRVMCTEFPFVVITSNGERELSEPFMRRCLQLTMQEPGIEKLKAIVRSHALEADFDDNMVEKFVEDRPQKGYVATDQLLNAIYLRTTARGLETAVKEIVLKSLRNTR